VERLDIRRVIGAHLHYESRYARKRWETNGLPKGTRLLTFFVKSPKFRLKSLLVILSDIQESSALCLMAVGINVLLSGCSRKDDVRQGTPSSEFEILYDKLA